MGKTISFKLALLITLVMGIALGFLYLLERQKIYNNIKESSRNLILQEESFHQLLGKEWDKNLANLMSHNNLRLYLNEYVQNPQEIPDVFTDSLGKVFADVTAYPIHLIHRISLINLDGQELIAAEAGKVVSELKNWYTNDYFREALSRPVSNPQSNQFNSEENEAYLYKSVPIILNNRKVAILTMTIQMSEVVNKYNYLLAAGINDQIMALTKHGKFLFAFNKEDLNKEELENVFVAIKQKASGDSILEYRQNVWSFIRNDDQGYYILFVARGQKITNLLNEEYIKLGTVFSISSFIMILLVFFSTRKSQRQQAKIETEKVIHSQRSHNFASISDEIRQPLNALMGALVTLEEDSQDEKPNPYLSTAKKTAIHLTELVNEFTDFAKISDGDFHLQPIEFDLRTTLNDIADIMSAQAGDKGLDISCLFSSSLPKRVKGDATRLRQVLINLISFAIKYTNQGEISICVSVDEFNDIEKMFHIDVSDTGNIIDQDSMLEHFKMFTADAYAARENSAGEGLGLALSKQLINLMRGDISVKENSAGGNTFRVTLPMPVVETVVSALPQDNLKGRKVLIVGEIEVNRNMLSHALSKWGMSGGTMGDFSHVAKVLQQASQSGKAYDACLIDVSLSSLSEKAFELVRQIRKVLDNNALKVIVLTVQGAPGDAKTAKDLGAQAYLTKPLTRNGMKEVLMRVFDSQLDKPAEFITRHTLREGEQDGLVRILVANSEDETQKHFVRMFESNRYKLDFARDGSALESAINNNVYDLVLVDINMPKFDVFTYVKKFRQYESNLNKALNVATAKMIRLPIIAIATENNNDLLDKCEKNGLDNLLLKPFDKESLQNLMKFHLDEHKTK